MLKQLRAALVSLAFFTVLTGIAYPLAVTGIAQAAFHKQANGSLIEKDGKVVGSHLIGRQLDDPKYFWGRLSATLDANGKALRTTAETRWARTSARRTPRSSTR